MYVYYVHLFCASAEHTLDAEANGHHIEGWAPLIVQYGETDVAIAVHVRVDRYLVTCEHHL